MNPFDWIGWGPLSAEHPITAQVDTGSHLHTLRLRLLHPDGSLLVSLGVNTTGSAAPLEVGTFDIDTIGIEFEDQTAGQTWHYPNPAHIARSPITGTDARGDWFGYRFGFDDAGGGLGPDGDFNDVVLTLKAYGDPSAVGWVRDPARSAALIAWSATHGRPRHLGRVDAAQVTVSLTGTIATAPTIGERFRLAIPAGRLAALGLDPTHAPRWTGEVTDVDDDQVGGTIVVTGVGRWARAQSIPIDGRAFPVELDDARVARVLDAVAALVDVDNIEPGTALLLPPADRSTAGDVISKAVESTGGQLVEGRDGNVTWQSSEHRRDTEVLVTLDASELLSSWRKTQHRGDLINDATIGYGRAGESVRVIDYASADPVDGLGPAAVGFTTDLVDDIAAHALGTWIVGRFSEPAWMLPTVTVDVLRTVLDPVKRAAVLALRHGDRIALTNTPHAPGRIEVFVEGTTETAYRTPGRSVVDAPEKDAWRVTLAVSDTRISGTSLRWIDVPDGLTWDDLPEDWTWLSFATVTRAQLLALLSVDGGTPDTEPDLGVDGGTPTSTYTSTVNGGTP